MQLQLCVYVGVYVKVNSTAWTLAEAGVTVHPVAARCAV